jgi:hypothetical protein
VSRPTGGPELAARRVARRLLGSDEGVIVLRGGAAPVLRLSGRGVLRAVPAEPGVEAAARRVATAATTLAGVGAPLVAPLSGPVVAEGLVVTLWEDADDGGAPDELGPALGQALRRLHDVGDALLRRGAVDLPEFDPADVLERHLTAAGDGLDVASAGELRARLRALLPLPAGRRTVLHTDAHAGNACLDQGGRVTFVDLDGLALGPGVYDLAALEVTERRLVGDVGRFQAAVEAYTQADADRALADVVPGLDDAALRRCVAVRELLSIAWVAGVGQAGPAEARRRLADVRAGRPARWGRVL